MAFRIFTSMLRMLLNTCMLPRKNCQLFQVSSERKGIFYCFDRRKVLVTDNTMFLILNSLRMGPRAESDRY